MKYAIRFTAALLLLLFSLNCNDDDPIQYQLKTQVSPEGAGNISPVSAMYNEGTEVEIEATANAEYVFKNWSDDASGNLNPLKIVMTDDMVITAVFEKVKYALSIEIVGEGSVNQEVVLAKSSTDYDSGTRVKLTAVPAAEWKFVGWSGDHEGSENPVEVDMKQAMSLTATFVKVQYALNIEIVGNGTVAQQIVQAKSTKDYDSGTIVQLTAIPSPEWEFSGWSGDVQGTENPIEITMSEAMSLTATFELIHPIPESVMVWVFGDGSVEQEWIGDPQTGSQEIRLTAHPAEGWYFVNWWGILDGWGDFVITRNPLEFDLEFARMYQDGDQVMVTAFFLEGLDNTTYIPDDHFEQALIDLGYDDVLDDQVLTRVVNRIEELDISNRNIEDLTGLEDFMSLSILNCNENRLQSLTLPTIPVISLFLQGNELTELDISSLGTILFLDIQDNLLTCVEVNETQKEQTENPGLAMWVTDEGVEFSLDCN